MSPMGRWMACYILGGFEQGIDVPNLFGSFDEWAHRPAMAVNLLQPSVPSGRYDGSLHSNTGGLPGRRIRSTSSSSEAVRIVLGENPASLAACFTSATRADPPA